MEDTKYICIHEIVFHFHGEIKKILPLKCLHVFFSVCQMNLILIQLPTYSRITMVPASEGHRHNKTIMDNFQRDILIGVFLRLNTITVYWKSFASTSVHTGTYFCIQTQNVQCLYVVFSQIIALHITHKKTLN